MGRTQRHGGGGKPPRGGGGTPGFQPPRFVGKAPGGTGFGRGRRGQSFSGEPTGGPRGPTRFRVPPTVGAGRGGQRGGNPHDGGPRGGLSGGGCGRPQAGAGKTNLFRGGGTAEGGDLTRRASSFGGPRGLRTGGPPTQGRGVVESRARRAAGKGAGHKGGGKTMVGGRASRGGRRLPETLTDAGARFLGRAELGTRGPPSVQRAGPAKRGERGGMLGQRRQIGGGVRKGGPTPGLR